MCVERAGVCLTISAVALHQGKDFLLRERPTIVAKLQDLVGREHKADGSAYLIMFDLEFARNALHNW